MTIDQTTRQMATRLKSGMLAERVWLFGSQARGNAGPDSDIDLLAVVPHSTVSRYQRAIAARRELVDRRLWTIPPPLRIQNQQSSIVNPPQESGVRERPAAQSKSPAAAKPLYPADYIG